MGPIPLPLRSTPWIHFLPLLNPLSCFSTLCLLVALLAVLRWSAHLLSSLQCHPKVHRPLWLSEFTLFFIPQCSIFPWWMLLKASQSRPVHSAHTLSLPPPVLSIVFTFTGSLKRLGMAIHSWLMWMASHWQARKWLQLCYFYTPVSHSIIKYLLSAHNVRDTFRGAEEEVRLIPTWTLVFWSLHSCASDRPSCPVWSENSHFLTECVPLTVRVTSVSCDVVSHLTVSVICLHSPHHLHPSYTGVHTQVHTHAHMQGMGCPFAVNCVLFGRITLWTSREKERRKGGRERERKRQARLGPLQAPRISPFSTCPPWDMTKPCWGWIRGLR